MEDFWGGFVVGVILTVVTTIVVFTIIGVNIKMDTKINTTDGTFRVINYTYSSDSNQIVLDVYKLN
jgi:hypothetical protein